MLSPPDAGEGGPIRGLNFELRLPALVSFWWPQCCGRLSTYSSSLVCFATRVETKPLVDFGVVLKDAGSVAAYVVLVVLMAFSSFGFAGQDQDLQV